MTAPLLVPHLAVEHAPGRDLVWCASLDLAWRALREVVGEPPSLAPPGGVGGVELDRALSLVRALNASAVREDVAPAAWALALAGEHTADWVARAEAALRERFGDVERPSFPHAPQPGQLVAYAYANVRLPFAVPFAPVRAGLRFAGKDVDAFGIGRAASPAAWPQVEAQVAQVLVHHHRFAFEYDPDQAHEDDGPSEEWVLELQPADRDGRVIVACVLPERTFEGTVAVTLGRLREDAADQPDARLQSGEKLQIPCLDLDVERRYPELHGRALENEGHTPHAFGEVLERVRFTLDEGGARVVSEAVFGGLSLPPRSFVCQSPFLVMVLRRGARLPFLAAWVETAAPLRRR